MDILQAYIDIGVMMRNPSARTEKELRQHYKVPVNTLMTTVQTMELHVRCTS